MKAKASKCNKHNRIRITPENWRDLQNLKKILGLSLTIPALANDMIARGISKHLIK
jgi:hypothetical protein